MLDPYQWKPADRFHHRCGTCRRFGFCAPDCSIAPWNFEHGVVYPAPSAFAYLLRQRRWVGSPVDRQDTRFLDARLESDRYISTWDPL